MRRFNRVRTLSEDEHRALVQGTKSRSGFIMRRSHILLLSGEGLTPQQIAERLHCGDQTVRNVIRAFDKEGLGCLEEKSSRPHRDNSTFTAEGLQRLADLVHRSPRDFGGYSSLWSLAQLAKVCFREGIVARPISYESVRRALVKLGLDWRHARHQITSHDPQYERKMRRRNW